MSWHTNAHTHAHVCMCFVVQRICVHIYVCTHCYLCMFVCMYTFVQLYMLEFMYAHIYENAYNLIWTICICIRNRSAWSDFLRICTQFSPIMHCLQKYCLAKCVTVWPHAQRTNTHTNRSADTQLVRVVIHLNWSGPQLGRADGARGSAAYRSRWPICKYSVLAPTPRIACLGAMQAEAIYSGAKLTAHFNPKAFPPASAPLENTIK